MPDGDELVDPVQARLLDELRAHHQVVVEEPAGILAVGPDAAHDGGEVNDDVGPCRLEHAHDIGLPAKVIVAAARDERRRDSRAGGERPRRRRPGSRRHP